MLVSNDNKALKSTLLFKKVYGALIGGSIGDAMGGPVESMHYKAIRKRVGKVTDFLEYKCPPGVIDPQKASAYTLGKTAPGSYTDDTRLKHLLCSAILKQGGRVNADDIAKVWIEEMNPEEYWHSVRFSFYKIALTDVSPRDAGWGNISDNSSPMCIAPIGIINIGDPQTAFLEAVDVVSLLHDGYAREAAGVVAAAVAEAMRPKSSVHSVIEASVACVRKESEMVRRIWETIEIAKSSSNVEEFTERFYESYLIPWKIPDRLKASQSEDSSPSVDPLEAVPAALAIFFKEEGNPEKVILGAANFGRDCDTIAGIAGGIAGAYAGVDAIPRHWVEVSCNANPEPNQEEIAFQLTEVILKIKDKLFEIVGETNALLQA